MNNLQQLAISLKRLENLQDVDININIPVVGGSYFDCIKLNSVIAENPNTPIIFGDDQLIYPHITLKMGTLKGGHFENIVTKVGDYVKSIKTMNLTPLPVILKQPADKYYFCEIEDDRLLSISHDLNDLLCDDMLEPRFPLSKDNLHHITLGCKYPEDEVSDIIGKSIRPFIADRIQISILGKFGVCLGALKTFYLQKEF